MPSEPLNINRRGNKTKTNAKLVICEQWEFLGCEGKRQGEKSAFSGGSFTQLRVRLEKRFRSVGKFEK